MQSLCFGSGQLHAGRETERQARGSGEIDRESFFFPALIRSMNAQLSVKGIRYLGKALQTDNIAEAPWSPKTCRLARNTNNSHCSTDRSAEKCSGRFYKIDGQWTLSRTCMHRKNGGGEPWERLDYELVTIKKRYLYLRERCGLRLGIDSIL